MDTLKQLYNDKQGIEDLKNLFLTVLHDEAVTRVMKRENVSGIADANEIINKAFDRLDDMFKPEVSRKDSNQAK